MSANINIKNWSTNEVTVSVTNPSNMGGLANLNGNLAPGAANPATGNITMENTGSGEATFDITFTNTANGTSIGVVSFIWNNAYNLASNSNPGVLVADWINPSSTNTLSQAWLSVMILPFSLNWSQVAWSQWMCNFPNQKLNQMCIPGTHDSGTYMQQLSPTANGIEGDFTNNAVPQVVQTQSVSIAQQLSAGARFLDIRPGGLINQSNPFATTLYHIHSPDASTIISCAPLSAMLSDIAAFATANPKEIVIIYLSHFAVNNVIDNVENFVIAGTGGVAAIPLPNISYTPPWTNQQINTPQINAIKLAALYQVYEALSNFMLSGSVQANSTLSQIWKSNPGRNVIVMVDCTDDIEFGQAAGQINVLHPELFWPITSTNSLLTFSGVDSYADVDTIPGLLAWLQSANIPTSLPIGNQFSILQCQLTASGTDVLNDIKIALEGATIIAPPSPPAPSTAGNIISDIGWVLDPPGHLFSTFVQAGEAGVQAALPTAAAYANIPMAISSNPAVRQLLSICVNPAGQYAQPFATNANIFITDNYDGAPTNWAIASNLYRDS